MAWFLLAADQFNDAVDVICGDGSIGITIDDGGAGETIGNFPRAAGVGDDDPTDLDGAAGPGGTVICGVGEEPDDVPADRPQSQ